ncbi:MAG: hypothetical protein WD114_03795, partial [Phycisphaerales bacterium]
HTIRTDDFIISPGITAGTRVVRGETPVAIEGGRAVTSPVRGRVFLPNMQKQKRPGDDGFFIVRRVGEGWLGLSARLRRQEWLHRMLTHLPGVYPCADGTLCVDADIAAVLKRELLHLLGYRLLRYDRRDAGHGPARVLRGLRAFAAAFFRGPIRDPDRDDPRFWIVRRHRLDR